MSVSFDWDFSEEPGSPREPRDELSPARQRRWLRRGVIGILLVAVVGAIIGAWVHSRLEVVEKGEAELRAVVELELKTVADGDAEILRSLQDPTDPTWQDRQATRYASPDSAQFAPAPGLTRADRPAEIKAVHFFGRTGRVELIQWYEGSHNGASEEDGPSIEPLPFQTTWFYRQDDEGNWYHVAPPDDYWGIPYSWHGSKLDIRATEVESGRIDPIADDLARLLLRGCQQLRCPRGERYTLSFIDAPVPRIEGDWWVLPALYLTGMPEGESAQTAWARALKLWIVEALARAQSEDKEIAERLIFRQLVTRLQEQLGLLEPVALDVERLTDGVREGSQQPLWSLWQAKAHPDDPERTYLLEAEVAALLALLEDKVGTERLFELLPALDDHLRLGDALMEVYDLDRTEFSNAWLEHLSGLTGVSLAPLSATRILRPIEGPLEPPPAPAPPAVPPGDQIAFICDGRIWVGDADGSGLFPLTAREERFSGLQWSPDGRWLLTAWQPAVVGTPSVLYLLAADGTAGGRLLMHDPSTQSWPIGWSPDGREAIYYSPAFGAGGAGYRLESLNLVTGITRTLPGAPVWSPDGDLLIYNTWSSQAPVGAVWLADGDWQNPRQITAQGSIWTGQVWSPDGSRASLILFEDSWSGNAIALYDVQAERFTDSLTAADLMMAFRDASNGYVSDGMDPATLVNGSFKWMWIFGWSADGENLLVWVGATKYPERGPMALVTIPAAAFDDTSTDGGVSPEPRLLVAAERKRLVYASWSPGKANRLSFTWLDSGPQGEGPTSFILDLDGGAIYTTTESWNGVWSPDGEWMVFGGQGQVTIVDQEGQERFTLTTARNDWCADYAWNPVADLSALAESPSRTLQILESPFEP